MKSYAFNFSIITFLLIGCINSKSETTRLTVGVPAEWGELTPALQHTAYADAILSNQFETLVRVGAGGVLEPLAAKSWKADSEFKTFTFKIDVDRKFADGKALTSSDFKDSWESALKLEPKSAKSSLQDVLYKIVGFDDFEKKGTLVGIETPDSETLTLRFDKSFRTALVYLSGSRMAVYRRHGERYVGTGPYDLVSQNSNEAYFRKNRYSSLVGDFDEVRYVVVPTSEAVDSLRNGKVQIYTFAEKTQIDDCLNEAQSVGCYLGSASRHFTITLNGKKGSLFSNNNHRKAFQALWFKNLKQANLPPHLKETLILDPQVFLPLQKGQIPPEAAMKLVTEGEIFIPDFLKATKTHPLIIKTSKTELWIIDYVKSLGVAVSDSSGPQETKDIVETYYKKHNTDILAMGIGVVSGDPDGIYHALGKDGSISSPMSYRGGVAALLEEGRSILDEAKISSHYQKVSRAVLVEVPFIHVGFLRTKMAYRRDLVTVKNHFKQREDDRLISFSPL